MTNKVQIVIMDIQTSLTADSQRCLIESDNDPEVSEQNSLNLNIQYNFLESTTGGVSQCSAMIDCDIQN